MTDEQRTIESLRDTLRKVAAGNAEHQETIDWEAKKTWWLEKLGALYADIKTWCRAAGIGTEEFAMILEEERIGAYKTQKLVVQVGRAKFIFVPVGQNIIGGRGRVDILYNNTKTLLTLFAKGERPRILGTASPAESRAQMAAKSAGPAPAEIQWCFSDVLRSQYTVLTEKTFLEFLAQKMAA